VELIFQILAEIIFQFVVEGMLDVCFGKKLRDARPLLRFLLFLLVGAILGGLSLLLLPAHIISDRQLRYVAVLTIPVLIGVTMAKIGSMRAKRGSEPNDLEHFFSSWGLAFTFGAVRVLFAE
jgi:hypothetical protein